MGRRYRAIFSHNSWLTFWGALQEERKKQLEEEIPRLEAEIDFLKVNSFSSEQVMRDAKDLQSRWPELNTEEKRQIVECVTNKIVVAKDEIDIELCYLPSFKKVTESNWSLGDSNP